MGILGRSVCPGKNVMEVEADIWVSRGKHRGPGTQGPRGLFHSHTRGGSSVMHSAGLGRLQDFFGCRCNKILFLAGYRYPLLT